MQLISARNIFLFGTDISSFAYRTRILRGFAKGITLSTMSQPELAIQKHLRCQSASELELEVILARLKQLYGISSRLHQTHKNLILLKYDQVTSPMEQEIVQDCRGIVLDHNKNWEVVGMSFRKFFNYGERNAANIEWSTATVQEKVDGSLCMLYVYDKNWQVATSGFPDAAGPVSADTKTFADYFWETFASSGMRLPSIDCGLCFFFELAGPLNRVIVQHSTASLTVLGCRRIPSLEEASASDAAALLGRPDAAVRSYPIRSFDELAATFAKMSPLRQEGYVVVDGNWNRVKVKSPGYVSLHHLVFLRGAGLLRAIVNIVRRNEADEVLASFPAFNITLKEVAGRYETLVAEVEADAARLAGIVDQRSFAREATKTPWSGALFHLRAGKVATVREALAGMKPDTLIALLRLGDQSKPWVLTPVADSAPSAVVDSFGGGAPLGEP